VNRTVQHVDLSWNPTPWSGLVPFGIADGRASGLLFERHESFGIHDDGRFPRAVGKVTAPGVFDAVANFDTNKAVLLQATQVNEIDPFRQWDDDRCRSCALRFNLIRPLSIVPEPLTVPDFCRVAQQR
jgi:hypothetical protein